MRKSFSRVLSLILVIALTLSFTSFTTVFAAEKEFKLDSGTVNSVVISASGADKLNVKVGSATTVVAKDDVIVLSGGTAMSPTAKKCPITVQGNITFPVNIRLKNVNIQTATANVPALNTGTNTVNLTLEGTNKLNGNVTSAITSTGPLTINGLGSLELLSSNTSPVGLATGVFTMSGGTITAPNGITATGGVTIGGGSKVTTTVKGISGNSITVKDTATVTATSTNNTAALNATDTVTVSGGNVTATGNTTAAIAGKSVAVSGGALTVQKGTVPSLTISGNGKVAAASGAKLTGTTALTAGTLTVASGATVANVVVTGGTYQNATVGSGDLFKTTLNLPGVKAITDVTLNGTQHVKTDANGNFVVYLPKQTFAVDALTIVTSDSKTYQNKKAITVSAHSGAVADAGMTLKTAPLPSAKTVTLTAPAASAYKKDIEVQYTCADKAAADAFLAATKTIAFGSTASLKLDPKNGYTITKTSDTKGTITIKGAANKTVKNDIPITVTANGFNAASTKVNVAKNTAKSVETLIVEAPLGTSASKLKKDYLSTVSVTLDGTTEKETFPVTNWDTDKYRSETRAEQTITGTITKTTSDVVDFPSGLSKKATAKVTLYRDDNDDDDDNSKYDDNRGDSQDFWDDIKDQIEDADKGDKVYADTGAFDKVPTTVLEELKGKDVTLIIERPVGKDIVINGKNVKTPPSGLIYYSVTELATLYKNGGTTTTSSKASTASSRPSTGGGTTGGGGGTTGGGTTTSKPATPSLAPLPSSSAAESSVASSSREEEESISSEEEDIEADLPVDETEVEPEKKKMSPVMAVVIVTAGVAALSGIAALVVLRKRP